MLLRVLILVFAFNAMIPSAFAIGAMSDCQMIMDGSESAHDANLMEVTSAIATTAKMPCTMADIDGNCTSIQCLSNCSINISTPLPLSHESLTSFKLNPSVHPQSKVIHFYHIVLPVFTPPPLV